MLSRLVGGFLDVAGSFVALLCVLFVICWFFTGTWDLEVLFSALMEAIDEAC